MTFRYAGHEVELCPITGLVGVLFPGGGLVSIKIDDKTIANLPANTSAEELLRIAKEKASAADPLEP